MKSINIPRDINPQQIHIINRSTPVIDNNIPLSSVRIKRDKHLGSAQNLPPKKPMMRQLSRPPRRRRRPVGVAPLKLLPHVLRFMARNPAWLQQRVAFKIAVGGYPSKTGKHHRAGCSWLSDCRRHSFPPDRVWWEGSLESPLPLTRCFPNWAQGSLKTTTHRRWGVESPAGAC
jgi:hypothetical protein